MTILAARRVLPPLLITPAKASYPRMKETGPEAVPPPASGSREGRMPERLEPVRQLVGEGVQVLHAREVALLLAPGADRVHDARDQALHAALPVGRAEQA